MSLALSLRAAGLTDVTIHESAPETRELGVGINLFPHAVRELDELGLLTELEPLAATMTELVMYSRHGRRIHGERRGRAAGYRWPQLSIHRGRLLGVLYRTVLDRLGPEQVHHGHHLESVTNDGDVARARFVDRRSGDVLAEAEADVVVGCDGVRSAVRAHVVPDAAPPTWNGIVAWRGVSPAEPFLTGRSTILVGHHARRVVAHPITTACAPGDPVLVNWVAEHRVGDGRAMPQLDWDRQVDVDELLELFGRFRLAALDLPALLRAAPSVYQYPVVEHRPLDRWTSGRVTLLGDAAHPRYPVGSNGASQAILDARALARHLALAGSVDDALAAYEHERVAATSPTVLAHREVGAERCLEIVEERAPDGFERLEEVFAPGELERLADDVRASTGFAVHALNTRPSFSVEPVA